MKPYKDRRCHNCGEGTVRLVAVPGRLMAYKTLHDLEVPASVEIPTCAKCGSEWVNDSVAAAIDEAMEPVYRNELRRMVQAAIDTISAIVSQRDLERALGLSAGYISKLKNSERDPSPDLVAHLCTIARSPKKRLLEIEEAWNRGAERKTG